MVDTFSLDTFRKVVWDIFPGRQIKEKFDFGEWEFEVVFSGTNSIIIRSSIGLGGVSKEVGADSIRVFVQSRKMFHKKDGRWTTRTVGWEKRLKILCDRWIKFIDAAGICKVCGSARPIFKVNKEGKNKGRFFSKCCEKDDFVWLTP